jgi:hypothetical protein
MNGRVIPLNSRLAFIIFAGLYLSVLLVSYLLGHFYPFFAPYGWLLVPVVASFFVGYLIREVDTAVKLIIVCLTLNTGIVFGLLSFSSVENAFNSMPTFASYLVFNILLSVLVSFVGITVRDYVGLLLESSIKVKFLFVVGMLLLMGTISTWFSFDFYRVTGEPMRHIGDTVRIISCGFPLPYVHITDSYVHRHPQVFDIQPFNDTNFLLDTLFYTSIYSMITAFVYTIIHIKKTKKIDEYLTIG